MPDWCTQGNSTAQWALLNISSGVPMQAVLEAVAGTSTKLRCERRSPSDGTAGQPDLVPPGVAGYPNPEPASTPMSKARKMAHVVYKAGIWMFKSDPASLSVHTA